MAMSRSRASKDQFKLHGQELEKRTKAVTNQGSWRPVPLAPWSRPYLLTGEYARRRISMRTRSALNSARPDVSNASRTGGDAGGQVPEAM